MSLIALEALLADASQAGAYFVDAGNGEAMIEAANSLGYTVAVVDLAGCTDEGCVLDAIAQALHFPDWFGCNFDALSDCLGDLSWLPAAGYVLLLQHAQGWQEAAPTRAGVLIEVLNGAAAQWAQQGIAFWSLLPMPAEWMAGLEDAAG